MLPIWVYGAVALSLALMGFGLGQLVPGLGMAFVAATSTGWTVYAARRRTQHRPRR